MILLAQADIGRPINEIVSYLDYPSLEADARVMLDVVIIFTNISQMKRMEVELKNSREREKQLRRKLRELSKEGAAKHGS